MLVPIAIIGLITGTLIGTVGIGGILLAPLLSYMLGMDIHLAMATSSFSFLFTGIVGTVSYAKKRSISWRIVLWLSIGIIPATIIGAKVNTSLSADILIVLISLLIVFSGLYALYNRKPDHSTLPDLKKFAIILIGLIVGFGSALTGTGGPVLLLPILVALSFPVLTAIGVSQAIQLPIAIFTTTGYLLFGSIDLKLGLYLGIVQAIGVVMGASIAHNLPSIKLRQLVAIALIVVGGLLIAGIWFSPGV
jgi:uncharacterized membrane protein YfcA